MDRPRALATLILACFAGTALVAQQPRWRTYKISNTGIPGGEVDWAKVAPSGDVWVQATDPFHPSGLEGGVAVYDGALWKTYTSANSPLATPWVTDVLFDPDGSEWIATNGGLFHKQTESWTRYTSSNSQLANNSMGQLTLDPSGSLWMLHWNGAVSCFDGTTWNTWTQAQIGYPPTVVLGTLVVDRVGDVWVGTEYAGGLAKLDWGTATGTPTWRIHGNTAPHLFKGDDGNVWAIDLDINLRWAIFRYTGVGTQRVRMPDFGPGNIPYSTMRVLADGTYWLGTYTGQVGYYDGSGFSLYQFGGSHVYTIDVDADGHAWCAGKGGAKELDRATGRWTYFNYTNTGLADNGIQHIEFDADGRGWFATTIGGISQFDGSVWAGHSPYNGGKPFWPVSTNGLSDGMAAHPDGSMWVGAGIEGVLEWDGRKWTRHQPGSWIEGVAVAADGSVWVGPVSGGVARYDGTRWTTVSAPLVCEPRRFVAAPNGDVFVCDRCGLMRYVAAESRWIHYRNATHGLPSDNVYDIDFHPDGSWWIASVGGLIRYDGSTWTTYTEANSGVPADFISTVEVAPNGDVWCGGFNGRAFPQYGGVSRFDGTTWTSWTPANSALLDEQIQTLEVDAQGNVWIGSAQGSLIVARFGNATFPKRWTNLGNGLAGTNGRPFLKGQGSLTSWSTVGLKLDGALGDTIGVFVLGASNLSVPFLGGVLVPSPDLTVPVATNATGRGSLVTLWPPVAAPGLTLHAQGWLLDAGAVQGVAASNAVLGVAP